MEPQASTSRQHMSKTMEDLPVEVVAKILSFLSFQDKVASMTVSKTWYSAALFALKLEKGFCIGMVMGNKPFCEGIRKIGYLSQISEHSIRSSRFKPPGERIARTRLAVLCPNVEILCDSGCDSLVSSLMLRAYNTTLRYLVMDSEVQLAHEVGNFTLLQYLKFPKLKRSFNDMKVTFPRLEYLDAQMLTMDQSRTLPLGLKGLKLNYDGETSRIHSISQTEVGRTLEVLHMFSHRHTGDDGDREAFKMPNLKDVSIRGLEEAGQVFDSLKNSPKLTRLHLAASSTITIENSEIQPLFTRLQHLTSLNLRFLIPSDPVAFWTAMVDMFAHKLQHLTFSTHFVSSQSLRLMTGFATLQTFNLIFIYDEPFLYNNVPEEIRNRQPFTAVDLLDFFQAPTASRASLRDITIHMQSLGSDPQVIRDLTVELNDMKLQNRLEMAEIKEVGNRNSIYV